MKLYARIALGFANRLVGILNLNNFVHFFAEFSKPRQTYVWIVLLMQFYLWIKISLL